MATAMPVAAAGAGRRSARTRWAFSGYFVASLCSARSLAGELVRRAGAAGAAARRARALRRRPARRRDRRRRCRCSSSVAACRGLGGGLRRRRAYVVVGGRSTRGAAAAGVRADVDRLGAAVASSGRRGRLRWPSHLSWRAVFLGVLPLSCSPLVLLAPRLRPARRRVGPPADGRAPTAPALARRSRRAGRLALLQDAGPGSAGPASLPCSWAPPCSSPSLPRLLPRRRAAAGPRAAHASRCCGRSWPAPFFGAETFIPLMLVDAARAVTPRSPGCALTVGRSGWPAARGCRASTPRCAPGTADPRRRRWCVLALVALLPCACVQSLPAVRRRAGLGRGRVRHGPGHGALGVTSAAAVADAGGPGPELGRPADRRLGSARRCSHRPAPARSTRGLGTPRPVGSARSRHLARRDGGVASLRVRAVEPPAASVPRARRQRPGRRRRLGEASRRPVAPRELGRVPPAPRLPRAGGLGYGAKLRAWQQAGARRVPARASRATSSPSRRPAPARRPSRCGSPTELLAPAASSSAVTVVAPTEHLKTQWAEAAAPGRHHARPGRSRNAQGAHGAETSTASPSPTPRSPRNPLLHRAPHRGRAARW